MALRWLSKADEPVLAAALELVVPGAGGAGGAGYVDQLLAAFTFDPPRIWAGGPFSGRHGGEPGFESWLELGTMEELAWRTRIEGSQGISAREFNGPVVGWQAIYREGIDSLGVDFHELDADTQGQRLGSSPAPFRDLLFAHGCESLYGDPVYGGNRGGSGWAAIGFTGDTLPRGWTDDEVTLGSSIPHGKDPSDG